jgi:hypothetical protein
MSCYSLSAHCRKVMPDTVICTRFSAHRRLAMPDTETLDPSSAVTVVLSRLRGAAW